LTSFTIPLRGSQTSYFIQRPAGGRFAAPEIQNLPDVKERATALHRVLPAAPSAARVMPTPQAAPAAQQSQTTQGTTQATNQPTPTRHFEPVSTPAPRTRV